MASLVGAEILVSGQAAYAPSIFPTQLLTEMKSGHGGMSRGLCPHQPKEGILRIEETWSSSFSSEQKNISAVTWL